MRTIYDIFKDIILASTQYLPFSRFFPSKTLSFMAARKYQFVFLKTWISYDCLYQKPEEISNLSNYLNFRIQLNSHFLETINRPNIKKGLARNYVEHV